MGNQCVSSFWSDRGKPSWQDREIHWDLSRKHYNLRPGEYVEKIVDYVEDTRGDSGLGTLQITNLRVMWRSLHSNRLSLSVGLGTVGHVSYNMCTSNTFGRTRGTSLSCHSHGTTYEFTFSTKDSEGSFLYYNLDSILRKYQATRCLREIMCREDYMIDESGQINVVDGESVELDVDECFNLTGKSRFPGKLYLTSNRFVWVCSDRQDVNISLPYISLKKIRRVTTALGSAFVLRTKHSYGRYILGFRIVSAEVSNRLCEMLKLKMKLARNNPCLGPLIRHSVDNMQYLHNVDDINDENDRKLPPLTQFNDPYSGEKTNGCGASSSKRTDKALTPCSSAFCITPISCILKMDRNAYMSTDRQIDDQKSNERDVASIDFGFYNNHDTDNCFNIKCDAANTVNATKTTEDCENATNMIQDCTTTSTIRVEPTHEGDEHDEFQENVNIPNNLQLKSYFDGSRVSTNTALKLKGRNEDENTFNRRFRATIQLRDNVDVENDKGSIRGRLIPLDITNETDLKNFNMKMQKYRTKRREKNKFIASKNVTCSICMTTSSDIAFDPCGHVCCCSTCAQKLNSCPICRTDVTKILRLFLQGAT